MTKAVGTQTNLSRLQKTKDQQTWTVDAHQEHTSMLTGIELDHPYAEDPTTVHMDFDDENDLNASFYLLTESMDTDDSEDIDEKIHSEPGSQRKFTVFENSLDSLFQLCPECCQPAIESEVVKVLKVVF